MTSFELWHLLTSSFGWTFAPSRLAGEMGDDLVHVRVGRRPGARSGRRRSGTGRPSGRRRPRARRPRSPAPSPASSSPSAAFVSAAASLTSASARMNARGNRLPEIGKLRTARCVEAPYRASAGTSISPIESRSIRVAGRAVFGHGLDCRPAVGGCPGHPCRSRLHSPAMTHRPRHRLGRLPASDGPLRDRGDRGVRARRRPAVRHHRQRPQLGLARPAAGHGRPRPAPVPDADRPSGRPLRRQHPVRGPAGPVRLLRRRPGRAGSRCVLRGRVASRGDRPAADRRRDRDAGVHASSRPSRPAITTCSSDASTRSPTSSSTPCRCSTTGAATCGSSARQRPRSKGKPER